MTCKVSSKTGDGLPYPEVTWQYPARLRDYVEVHSGDTFIHTDYVNSVSQSKYHVVILADLVVLGQGCEHFSFFLRKLPN